MGISTVAIYSEADAEAPYVQMADESFCIGKPRVHESYLQINRIIETAQEAGADAIHPGYGLLSENPEFARKCTEAGITFIGPTAEVIQNMGSKVAARMKMIEAGVPVVPGTESALADVSEATTVAENMGYPVMLKASAGGGGIGMQIVRDQEELTKAFEGNQKRAQMFFGNGDMYIEKYIENPRHIEIQLLADQDGNTIYLSERDCSVQRRHQKVVEEAPSPFLDESTRIKMGEVAVKAAKAIGYQNAGTIEFLVDENKNFYFLEMNTRLQVEHPVTEEITGLDLVEEQIRIAAGEVLRWTQEDINPAGHAIEVRIYAEDPNTFLPSPGTITRLDLPEGEGIRHELAVHSTSIVTPFYDPMIAKLIVAGPSREEAINRLIDALHRYHIEGVKTNIPMLKQVIAHEAFKKGEATTKFVEKFIQVNTTISK